MHSVETVHTGHSEFRARVALVCFGLSVAVVLGLQLVLRGEVDPLRQVLSDYAVAGGAVAFAFSTLALAAGTAFLVSALSHAGIPLTAPFRALMASWSGGLTLCALFRTDLTGAPLTAPGEVHRYAGIALFVSLPSATRLLARRLQEEQAWQALAVRLRRRTNWAWAALGGFALTQLPVLFPLPGLTREVLAQGLAERLVFVADLAVLGELAHIVLRTDRRGAEPRENPERKPC